MRKKRVPVTMSLCVAAMFLFAWTAPSATTSTAKWIPNIQRTTLSNGLTILTANTASNGLVTVGILIRAGSACDPTGKAGLANLVANGILTRTKKLGPEKLAAQLANLCITSRVDVNRDATLFLFQTQTNELSALFNLVGQAILSPSLDERTLDAIRARTIAMLRERGTDVRYVLNRNLYDFVFTGHPYGTSVFGTEASLNNITAKDLTTFYRDFYGANNATVAVVGDLEGVNVKQIVEQHFGDWKAAKKAPRALSTPTIGKTTPIRLVNRTGDTVSHICMAQPLGGMKSSNYSAWMALAEILGGGPFARLNRAVCAEIKGCYQIGAMVEPGNVSILRIGAMCHGKEVETVLNRIDDVMEQIARDGVTDEELRLAKARLERRIMASFADPIATTRTILTWEAHGIDATNPGMITSQINALSVDQLAQVAKNTLNRDQFALLVIGDRATVAEDLRRLADVEVVEFAGEIPVPAMRTILKKLAK